MGKFIITEEEKRQILSKYGLLNEQKPYAGPTPEEIEQSLPAQRVAWRANQIQSQNLQISYEDAEKQAYNELQNLFSPEEKVYWRANELKKADPNLSPEDAESKARTELNVPKQTTTGQKEYAGGPSLDPDAYEKFQKENPQPTSTQQTTTNQGQNVVADLNRSLATIGGEGKGVSTTTNQTTTAQSAPNYNVNYKVLTPQKLINIRTQINSTGKGNALTPEDLQALYTTISKLPNKK